MTKLVTLLAAAGLLATGTAIASAQTTQSPKPTQPAATEAPGTNSASNKDQTGTMGAGQRKMSDEEKAAKSQHNDPTAKPTEPGKSVGN